MSRIFDHLEQHARTQGDRPALWAKRFDGGYDSVTWTQLAERARRFAAACASWVDEGRVLPLLLGKSPACVAAMLGTLGAPGVRLPVPQAPPAADRAHHHRHADAGRRRGRAGDHGPEGRTHR